MKQKFVDWAILAALSAFHGAVNYSYLAYDNLPPGWDQSVHLRYSLDYYRALGAPSITLPFRLLTISNYYPPLVYIATAPFYALFGPSSDAGTYVNIVFLAIGVFAVYGLGTYLMGRSVGLTAAAFLSFFPMVFGLSREYLLDTALVATVAATNYWVIKTGLGTRRQAVIYGLLLSCALLTKWTAILFTLGPLVFVAAGFGRPRRGSTQEEVGGQRLDRRRISPLWMAIPLRRLGVSALVVLFLAGSWYIPHLPYLIRDLGRFSNSGNVPMSSDPVSLFFFYYAEQLMADALFIFLLLVPGIYYLVRTNRRLGLLLALWVIPPYVILGALPGKDVRFILPIVPALVLVAVAWISAVSWRSRGRVSRKVATVCALALALALAGLNFAAITVGPGPLPARIEWEISTVPVVILKSHSHVAHPATSKDWHAEDVVLLVKREWTGKERAYVTVATNSYRFSQVTFAYYADLYEAPLDFHGLGEYDNYTDQIARSDFVILKTGDQGPLAGREAVQVPLTMVYLTNPTIAAALPFREAGSYTLPDGSTATILARG